MSNTRKIMLLILCIALGGLLGYFWPRSKPDPEVITKVEIVKEQKAIDSLSAIVKERDSEIERLKNNVKIIYKTREVKIKEIQELPLDSNVSVLRNNLAVSEGDTLPRVILTSTGDSTVEISEGNVKDINCAFVDLSASKELNQTYLGIIKEDSIIRRSQESIIENYSIISEKKDQNISSLESALVQEKKKLKKRTIVIGAVAVILGVLNFVR